MKEKPLSEFKAELRENIIKKICQLRTAGTVRMSERNLLQVTPTPDNGGPVGGDVAQKYAQIFHEVVSDVMSKYNDNFTMGDCRYL